MGKQLSIWREEAEVDKRQVLYFLATGGSIEQAVVAFGMSWEDLEGYCRDKFGMSWDEAKGMAPDVVNKLLFVAQLRKGIDKLDSNMLRHLGEAMLGQDRETGGGEDVLDLKEFSAKELNELRTELDKL